MNKYWIVVVMAVVAAGAGFWFIRGLAVDVSNAASVEPPKSVALTSLKLPAVMVTPDWLVAHLGDERLVIVDARSPESYAAGHLPGAVNLPVERLLDPDPSNGKNMAPVTHVQQCIGEVGIDMSRTVVIYDDSNYRPAARVFWVMEVHGHPSVAVLDGGLAGWREHGGRISTDAVRLEPRTFVAQMQPQRLASQLTVARAVRHGDATIIDARSDSEYRGEKSKAKRYGHIPESINVDFQNNLKTDASGVCSFRYSDELLDLYKQQLGESQRVITYCNTGNRASVSYLALRVLGYDAAVYDGSWMEWGNDPNLPVDGPGDQPLTQGR